MVVLSVYYSISLNIPFAVREFNHVERQTVWRQQDTRSILAFIEEGECFFQIGNQPQLLARQGDAVFIPGGQEYTRSPSGTVPCKLFNLHFESAIPIPIDNLAVLQQDLKAMQLANDEEALAEGGLPSKQPGFVYLSTHMPMHGQAKAIFNLLYGAYRDLYFHDAFMPLVLASCLCQILALLSRLAMATLPADTPLSIHYIPERLRQAVYYIRRNYSKKLTIGEISEYCNITPQHMNHLFRRHYDTTPVAFINTIKIAASKEMMRNTSLSVKEIAYELGFDDPHYFSRLFRKIEGVYPRDYQRHLTSFAESDRRQRDEDDE